MRKEAKKIEIGMSFGSIEI